MNECTQHLMNGEVTSIIMICRSDNGQGGVVVTSVRCDEVEELLNASTFLSTVTYETFHSLKSGLFFKNTPGPHWIDLLESSDHIVNIGYGDSDLTFVCDNQVSLWCHHGVSRKGGVEIFDPFLGVFQQGL